MITNCRNPNWANSEHTKINCEVKILSIGEDFIPFTATPDDVMEYGRLLFDEIISGKYGAILEYNLFSTNTAIQPLPDFEPPEFAQPVVASNPVDKLKAFLAANPDVAKILGT